MVYIYKKTIGSKPYYYLRASERKGKRIIVKDIAYLGNSIEEVKRRLNNLLQHKEKIRKAYRKLHNFIESHYYLEKADSLKLKKDIFLEDKILDVEACKMHYTNVFKKSDELTRNEILKNFVVELTFNTTSIEGNTITLQEARDLLNEGLTPKGKTLGEIYDMQNTERVFFEILQSKKEMDNKFIIDVHSNLMENVDKRTGYRTTDIRVLQSHFKATPAPYVTTDMNILLKWYNQNKNKMHPLVLATIFHHKFEKIHPFMDGNGRAGRIIMNFILIKQGYPHLIIRKKMRSDYLDALRTADKSGLTENKKDAYSRLVQFIADELSESYWNLFL